MSKLKVLILGLLITSLVVNGWLWFGRYPQNDQSRAQLSQKYPLLSKRIFTENQNDILINFIPLRTALREYIASVDNPVGVYFEYLPSGTSIGVNDGLEVILASLVKVPIVMGIYRQYERGVLKKTDTLIMSEKNIDKRFGDLWQRGAGTKMTVQETVEYALKYSDNTATSMLVDALPELAADNVFDSLDIARDTVGEITYITPKSYSSIFRSLYLSSYLSEASSNEILDMLTRTAFSDKLPKPIPKAIPVSHKIGVFNSINATEKAYSDCGIIYVPQRPYLLCVMAKTTDTQAQEYLSHVSKMVYGYVSAIAGGN